MTNVMDEDYKRRRFPTIYAGGRKSGKTTRLLQRASEMNVPILTHKNLMKNYLKHAAKELGLDNVEVIAISDLDKSGAKKPEKVIIDDIQLMLETALRVNIDSMSVTTYDLHDLSESHEATKMDNAIDGDKLIGLKLEYLDMLLENKGMGVIDTDRVARVMDSIEYDLFVREEN